MDYQEDIEYLKLKIKSTSSKALKKIYQKQLNLLSHTEDNYYANKEKPTKR